MVFAISWRSSTERLGNGHATDTLPMAVSNVTVQAGKQHTKNSFIAVRVYYGTRVERLELLPDSSFSHLDYGSKRYDTIRSVGLRSGTCYIIAEQY